MTERYGDSARQKSHHLNLETMLGVSSQRTAVSVTFDNLGEAAEIEQGLWPPERSTGSHPSVTEGLPWILHLLEELHLRATFFVEGINAEIYPEAVAQIARAGHEVAYHAWRHEWWGSLEPDREKRLLERGVEAFSRLGIRPRGFRPPGGDLTPYSLKMLEELDFEYCSPEGERRGTVGGVAVLPFSWALVDAYYYYEPFGRLREAHGDPEAPLPVALLRERMLSTVRSVARDGGYLCLIFHPFLALEGECQEAIRDVLGEVRRLAREGTFWCASCGELAERMLSERT